MNINKTPVKTYIKRAIIPTKRVNLMFAFSTVSKYIFPLI